MKKIAFLLSFLVLFLGQALPSFAQSLDPDQFVAKSKEFLGVKYRYGGASPSGFDCSGFTSYVFSQFGIELPHSSSAQYKLGTEVKKGEWMVGDLLFFNTNGRGVSHVGIYIGENKMIHAGRTGIAIVDLSTSEYYQKRYIGARRVATFAAAGEQTALQKGKQVTTLAVKTSSR